VVTGAVTEDNPATASGTLTSVDADTGQSNTFLAGSGSGVNSHGTYTVDTAGHWVYTLNSSDGAVQALGAGDTLTTRSW